MKPKPKKLSVKEQKQAALEAIREQRRKAMQETADIASSNADKAERKIAEILDIEAAESGVLGLQGLMAKAMELALKRSGRLVEADMTVKAKAKGKEGKLEVIVRRMDGAMGTGRPAGLDDDDDSGK